jgi:hypothetical protein
MAGERILMQYGLYQHSQPVPRGVKVHLALGYTDMRKGMVLGWDRSLPRSSVNGARFLVARRCIGRRARISDLHRDERRCSGRLELLLPTERHTRCYPIATRHLGKARARLHRLLNDVAFVRLAEPPPMPLASRRQQSASAQPSVWAFFKKMDALKRSNDLISLFSQEKSLFPPINSLFR